MCEPTTIALVATAVAGTTAAVGQYQQGQASRQMANYNATMAEYAAQDSQRRGEEEAQAIQRKASQLEGAQRSLMASRGLDLGVGTPADIIDSTDFFAQQDVNTARFNASRDAWNLRARGELERYEGRMAARNANMQAFSTLLGTAGSVSDKWATYNPKKPKGP
jgi:hypothetical protein